MRDEPESHDDLPIALRRTPRRNSRSVAGTSITASPASSPNVTQPQKAADHLRSSTTCRTPSKPKPKPRANSRKRVRFSDPGPEIQEDGYSDPFASTGLTPMVRRSSLGERAAALMASPSRKRQKRHSAPVRRLADNEDDEDDELATYDNVIRILPLRQILDDRIKRRIRRNGLSEEMNTICESKRRRLQEQKAEFQRLKDELAEKDAEIGRLHSGSIISGGTNSNSATTEDTARIALLEQQVQELRNKLRERTSEEGDEQDWSPARHDQYSDSYTEMDTMMDIDDENDDSGFGETTIAELVCSTPLRKRTSVAAPAPKSVSGSFPTPPSTSPPQPSTPSSTWRARPEAMTTPTRKTPHPSHSNTGVQASLPDPEKEALEAELGSLRRELAKLTNTLESHAELQSRISSKLALATTANPSASTSSSEQQQQQQQQASDIDANANANDLDIEAHLDTVLSTLSDRTSTLLELDTSISSLGFPGADALSMVSSLASSFRTARLELEYMTPGEVTLPLSSRGAEVLDLVLARLRDLARRAREHDDAMDEHRALEQSLREQLGARVDAGDALAARARDAERRAADLEAAVARLKDQAEALAASSRARAAERDARVADLEARLEDRRAELARLNREHGALLAHKDARVADLRRELDDAARALRDAQGTICGLRVENAGLARRVEEEGRRAREVVARMRGELMRVMGLGAEFLGLGTGAGAGEKKGGDADADAGRDVPTTTTVAADDGDAADDGGVEENENENVGDRAEEATGESASAAGSGTGTGTGVKMLTKRSLGSGGVYLAGELARRKTSAVDEGEKKGKGKGRKKRRYDSGLGFQDEDEADEEEEGAVEMVA
ncbi:hypothetical protein F4809DRAFT_663265 [Biscogniauxia mediterranea]|nr:hypothetical protein F4809DRAFT_663265 [Biscogniauxia mediterranea]